MGTKQSKKKADMTGNMPVKHPNGQRAMLRKIVNKTYAVVIVGVIFLIAFAALSIYSNYAKDVQNENTIYLNQYRLGSKTLTSSVRMYAVTGDETYRQAYEKELNEDKNRDIAWEGLKNNNLRDNEWAELEQIANLSQNLVPLEESAMDSVASGDTKAAQDYVFGGEYEKVVQEINTNTNTCIQDIQNRMERTQNILTVLMIVSMILFVIAFVVIVLQVAKIMRFSHRELLVPIIAVSGQLQELAQGNFEDRLEIKESDSEVGDMVAAIRFINGNFTRMIKEISYVLGQMGSGKYNVEVKEEYVGEFVEIKDSLVKIIADMKKTLETIRTSAAEIGGGSDQLARAATDLAKGCTDQATKVSEVSGAIQTMADAMQQKTTEAEEAVEISHTAAQVLKESNKKMNELKDAIGEISECSEQIRAIIGVIEDIANQTNLLSLNASIEAARAGEAGKGFAVVAEQVKNLAEQSTQAAGETTKLIQSTVDAVEKGIAISEEASRNMAEVMEGASQTTEKMSLMANAMMKESEGMHHINDSVMKVAEIVDNNSAASEETAAVSEQQTAQVQVMVNMMEQFEI